MLDNSSEHIRFFTAGAVQLLPGVRAKIASDGTVAPADVTDSWIGTAMDTILPLGTGPIKLRNAPGTFRFRASAAITAGNPLYPTASGCVDDAPGTGPFCGFTALSAATAAGDVIEAMESLGTSDSGAVEAVTTTNVLAASEAGSTFFLNSATGFVSTLPAPAAGARFTFIVATAPTSGNHTVVTASSANIIFGAIASSQDAGGSVSVVASADTVSFVANKALKGDRADFISDGTSWYVRGNCKAFDGMTTTQAS